MSEETDPKMGREDMQRLQASLPEKKTELYHQLQEFRRQAGDLRPLHHWMASSDIPGRLTPYSDKAAEMNNDTVMINLMIAAAAVKIGEFMAEYPE